MRRTSLTVAFLGLALACCSSDQRANSNICASKESLQLAGAEVTDPTGLHVNAERCVKQSAYLLSASEESAEAIAKASVLKCDSMIRAAIVARVEIGENELQAKRRLIAEFMAIESEQLLEKAEQWSIESKAGNCHLMWGDD